MQMLCLKHHVYKTSKIIMDKKPTKSRGPTLGEISYTLAEITEIKFEIAKSSTVKRNHKVVLKSEISPQYTRFP